MTPGSISCPTSTSSRESKEVNQKREKFGVRSRNDNRFDQPACSIKLLPTVACSDDERQIGGGRNFPHNAIWPYQLLGCKPPGSKLFCAAVRRVFAGLRQVNKRPGPLIIKPGVPLRLDDRELCTGRHNSRPIMPWCQRNRLRIRLALTDCLVLEQRDKRWLIFTISGNPSIISILARESCDCFATAAGKSEPEFLLRLERSQ